MKLAHLIKVVRRWHYTRRAKKAVGSFKGKLTASGPTKLTKNTYLGKNTNFNGLSVHGKGRVTIGDNFHSGRGCAIRTQTHNYLGEALPYDQTYVVEEVRIGENVWFGEGVLVLPGVTIGDGAIIQARSVVVSDIPALAIAGGHPCRQFAARDPEKYNRLKQLGRFV